MRRIARLLCRGTLAAGVIAGIAAPAAAGAATGGFTCQASAVKVSVLGAPVAEPVTANKGAASCASATKSLSVQSAGLPPLLGTGTIAAATSVTGPADTPAKQRVLAAAGVADLSVLSLPSLPLALPQVTLPASLKSVHVDLSALDAAVAQAGGSLSSVLGTGGSTCLLGSVCLRQAPALPTSIDLDITSAVQGLLPSGKLPDLQLLGVKSAAAYAGGQCVGTKPLLDGAAKVSGVNVLGQDVPLTAALDRTVTLIDQGVIDPSNAALDQLQLPASLTSLGLTLQNTPLLRAAVQQALDTLGNVTVLAPTLAQIKVVPGAKTRSGDSVTQQGAVVDVTVAGTSLLHAVLGEATAGATPGACAPKRLAVANATLQCTKRRLVLVDVVEGRRRVTLRGVADPSLVGRKVAIRFGATGRTVAHAKVRRNATFATTAPLPPASLRGTNRARYQARVGHERSLSLKLRRRMVLRSVHSGAGKVTIRGRVLPPLGAPARTIVLKRRISCKHTEVVRRFHPRPDGSFSVTVKAPKGTGAAVYRLSTSVRKNRTNRKLYPTFTLPRAVAL